MLLHPTSPFVSVCFCSMTACLLVVSGVIMLPLYIQYVFLSYHTIVLRDVCNNESLIILCDVLNRFHSPWRCAVFWSQCYPMMYRIYHVAGSAPTPLPPIDTIWAMMIVWRTRGDYRTARAVLEAITAFSAMHTYYEQLLQVKQICLCLTGFTSLCLDAYVFLCSLVFHCVHVVLL